MPVMFRALFPSRRWLAACLFAVLATAAQAQLQPPADAVSAPLSLESDPGLIAQAALGTQRGSVMVGLLRDGKAGYGAAFNPGPPPPRATDPASAEQPMFEIGSVTKVFTGLLLAQAVERRELALDDTLGKLLADKNLALAPAVAGITLRQLVTHSACLPVMADGVEGGSALARQLREFEPSDFWPALARIKLTAAAPPCQAAYSNFGMALLGQVMAAHYRTSWAELVRARITEPLGMNDTVIQLGDKASRMTPAFSGERREPLLDTKGYVGAVSLRSTAADMLTLARAIVAGAKGPLGPAAERMLAPLGRYEGAEIGYAMMVRGPASHHTYYHAGLTEGFRTLLLLAPDTGEAMVVLSSNVRAPLQSVMLAIGKSRYPVPTAEVPLDPQRLDDYRGVFRIDKRTALSFVVRDGRLLARMSGRGLNLLTPTGDDRFAVVDIGAQFTFQRVQGKVVSVTLAQGGSALSGQRTGSR